MSAHHKANNVRKLSDREHVLIRPGLYLGGMTETEVTDWFVEKDSIVRETVRVVPAFLKIVNEIIDNSVDESLRTAYDFANKISVAIAGDEIKVTDNGRGIPTGNDPETGVPFPVIAWTEAKAGSNFDNDDTKTWAGANGVGSMATACFSKRFVGETCDGKKKITVVVKDNLETKEYSASLSSVRGTVVTFTPDLVRFGLTKIDDVHLKCIKNRLYFLAVTHPAIKFTFNGEVINASSGKVFAGMFSPVVEFGETPNYLVAVSPNPDDDFQFCSYVNGLNVIRGGNHISYIADAIIGPIRDKLVKKHPKIKPSDIKNKLRLLVVFRNFTGMISDSQTKETLSNSNSSISNYLGTNWGDFVAKITQKILANKEIIDPIVEMFQLKEDLAARKLMTRPKKKISVPTYVAPIGEPKYLFLTEGLSAMSGLMDALGRDGRAYLPLRGKFKNVQGKRITELSHIQEVKDVAEVLGLDFSLADSPIALDKVVIATDQDPDGKHIRLLLLAFFNRFCPSAVKNGQVCYLETPIVVAYDKGKPKKSYFNLEDYHADRNLNYKFKYFKGLGSWDPEEFRELIGNNLEDYLEPFTDVDDNLLDEWLLEKNSDIRKNYLRGKELSVFKV